MLQTVLQYQEVDKKLWKIEQDLSKSEERRKAKIARNILIESEESIKKIDRRSAELLSVYDKARSEYKNTIETIKEYDRTAGTLKSCDEVMYLQKKVNELSELLKCLEGELSSVSNEMEEIAKNFNEIGKRYQLARVEYETNRAKFEELKKSKAEIVGQIKQKLEELSKNIDKALFEKYTKKRDDRTFPVIVPLLANSNCGGCSMELSLNEVDKVKTDSLTECEHCRRFIYKERA